MREKRQKAVIYKRARFNSDGPELRDLLAAALQSLPTVGDRRESIAPTTESPMWRLIGYHRVLDHFVFGVLMRYIPGLNPAFVVDDPSAEVLTVTQLAAPLTEEGNRRELLEGMLFFGSIDNHVVMMQSAALRSKQLEDHLQWLLRRARLTDDTQVLHLADQPPQSTVDRLSRTPVRSLDVGGLLAGGEEPRTAHAGESTVLSSGNAAGVLDFLKGLMSPDRAAALDDDALAGANIHYTLKLKYAYKTTDGGHRFMNEIGSALRHVDDVTTKVHLADGGVIEGDDLRLAGHVSIELHDGVPRADEVFEAMRIWLIEKLDSGNLSPS
jgi:hypothetical protein